jgi:transposase InsO family protein
MILALMDTAVKNGARLKKAAACLGLSARTLIRWRKNNCIEDQRHEAKREAANKLSLHEREQILAVATSPAFRDLSPKQIVPKLADQGRYLGSESSFYRILKEHALLTHRHGSRPAMSWPPRAHVATGPCQVWSWDITFLRTSVQGMFFHLYLFLDVWSRKIVAAEVFPEESMEHSAWLFQKACLTHALNPESLVLHSDNGGPMKGSTMLATLQKLGVVPSFSRPRVSDDNPYSEAIFRTLKYHPQFPPRAFETLEQAQAWVDQFVIWYNTVHLHSAIRFVTPDDRHYGRELAILENRHRVYQKARRRRPDRWTRKTRNWEPVRLVWLNPEKKKKLSATSTTNPKQEAA